MNVLITGSEGFVGSSLQIESKKYFDNIYLLDKIDVTGKDELIKIDLSSKDLDMTYLKSFFKSLDMIIHLAAAKGDFMLTENDFYKDNVQATVSLIKIADYFKVKSIIHYSTVSVYGHDNLLKDETAELKPNNPYGKTKLDSEQLLMNWRNQNNGNLTILRPSVIYGINNYANMFNLLELLNKKYPITIGNGDYVKSLISLENLIDITIFVSKRMKGLQIYNCTDEPYPRLFEVINYITKVNGFWKPKIKIPVSLAMLLAIPFEILSYLTKRDFKVSRERIHKFSKATDFRSDLIRSIGYTQRFKTEERLQRMAKWYLTLNKSK